MTSRLDITINCNINVLFYGCKLLVSGSSFSSELKEVSDFEPTLVGIFIRAPFGFDKDLIFQS
jgi:hypothetical protein